MSFSSRRQDNPNSRSSDARRGLRIGRIRIGSFTLALVGTLLALVIGQLTSRGSSGQGGVFDYSVRDRLQGRSSAASSSTRPSALTLVLCVTSLPDGRGGKIFQYDSGRRASWRAFTESTSRHSRPDDPALDLREEKRASEQHPVLAVSYSWPVRVWFLSSLGRGC